MDIFIVLAIFQVAASSALAMVLIFKCLDMPLPLYIFFAIVILGLTVYGNFLLFGVYP